MADTPEVQAEKQRFYQLYKSAADAAAAAPDVNVFPQHQTVSGHHQPSRQFDHRFASQNAIPVSHQKWTGPLAADVPAGLPGSEPNVRNTPEVEAAIAQFNRAFSDAVVATRPKTTSHNQFNQFAPRAQPNHFNSFSNTHSPNHFQAVPRSQPQVAAQPRWTGPLAATVPAGLPGSVSQVQDTPEVQAAKAQFSQAFHHQLSNVVG